MAGPEAKIEKHLVDGVTARGGLVRKLRWIGRRGAADRLVVWPNSPHRKPLVCEDLEMSVICRNRIVQKFGPNTPMSKVAKVSDADLRSAGFRVRDVKEIREAAAWALVETATTPAIIHFVELKAPGKKPEDLQEREIARLRGMGCVVLVLDSIEAVDAYLKGRD